MVLREASSLAALGAVIGVAAAAALSRYVRAMLFGIAPSDPVTIGGAVTAIMAVAVWPAGCPRGRPRGSIRWPRSGTRDGISATPVGARRDAVGRTAPAAPL